jgi:uncharacterized protein YyaL (SSP411 family)
MTANRLAQETSPYLLQHCDNPVDWQPWDRLALDQARLQDKPILLSIGYSTCHWCHVMAHESFENAEIAALMNKLYINIKVDREERPDLDGIYQRALSLLGQQGGWPLTMFLTPAGEPFWGGTYFPPEQRYGRAGFIDVLRMVDDAYRGAPEKVAQNNQALTTALNAMARPAAGGEFSADLQMRAARRLLDEIDPVHGGLGGAPKFPQTMALELLWRAYGNSGDVAFRDAVVLSADRMCQGGIYDHLGGGFSRYSVDDIWLAPHFEKMLYDNALLLDLLCALWQETGAALFKQRAAEVAGWAMGDMIAPDGGFAAAYDADSEGVEGKYYVWQEAEIDRLLGDEAARFKAAYDVTARGNWEGKTILNRTHLAATVADNPGPVEDDEALAPLREILLRIRAERVPPLHDDKVLADWNGLMIAALARAGAAFDRRDWIDAAIGAFDFVATRMTVDGRLRHSYRADKLGDVAFIDDYAALAGAAIALYETTGEAAYLARAEDWVAVADTHYWDHEAGGYFFTADDGETLIVRSKTAYDSATPSGNGLMIGVLARLHALTAKPAYRTRGEALAQAFALEADQNPAACCTLLNGFDLLRGSVQLVIIGDQADDATRALRRAAFETNAPNRVLATIAPDATLPEGHPAQGKTAIDGKPTAYVCRGETCSLPITEPDALREALRRG